MNTGGRETTLGAYRASPALPKTRRQMRTILVRTMILIILLLKYST